MNRGEYELSYKAEKGTGTGTILEEEEDAGESRQETEGGTLLSESEGEDCDKGESSVPAEEDMVVLEVPFPKGFLANRSTQTKKKKLRRSRETQEDGSPSQTRFGRPSKKPTTFGY